MGFDSTADLLFRIGADPSEAADNITRFRQLLTKDLSDMGNEFDGWAKKVFGSIDSVKGVMVAGTAAIAAGIAAAAAAAEHATEKYMEYTEQVHTMSERTGIAVEDASKLRFAAQATGTEFGSLTTGLTKFASTIDKANQSGRDQVTIFDRMKISRDAVAAGERQMLPLLMQVADWFSKTESGVQKAAAARELFARGGKDLIDFLSRGSQGLKTFTDEAERMGLILHEQDVVALKEYKAALAEVKAVHEALDIQIGQKTLPLMINLKVMWAAFLDTVFNPKQENNAPWYVRMAASFGEMKAQIEATAKVLEGMGEGGGLENSPAAPKELENWYGLSNLLERVKGQIASTGTEEEKAAAEAAKLQYELGKATEEFQKLSKEGKLSGESATRETAALKALPKALGDAAAALERQIAGRRAMEQEQAHEDLLSRLRAQQEQTFDTERQGGDQELTKLWEHLGKKNLLTQENIDLLTAIEAAGRSRIGRAQLEAYEQELMQLQGHLAQMVQAQMTTRERLALQYDMDLAQYSEVEEQKALKTAQTEAAAEAIRQQFALNRQMLLTKYGNDLMVLYNSQGWQGVFGSYFAQYLRGNEELLREWAQSADQAFMMVRISSEVLREDLQQLFGSFAQGMAANIAYAIVYKKSIGEAMQAAAAAALESLAAQAFVQAIFATALGFIRLAEWDFAGAANAFMAAGLFASVGAAAAIAGRAIAPKQASAGAGSGKASAAGAGQGSGAGAGGSASTEPSGPRVAIYVNGHIVGASGIEQLTEMINDAVQNRDVRLVATQTRQGAQATQ